ncbi:MFS transporter [Actinoplanes sp. TBRC 11911]|uniref:MFS transporter n=1 Tax=Actinoplanes sp. TBRC 11911 TaxID=2729386 RepID=UPI00145DFCB7|nr:MFS transporter [Actinoplanes sp. TBRC 11911]NMO49781.1 MFS transporter [Actinoplanes sp. TBRC 11911]
MTTSAITTSAGSRAATSTPERLPGKALLGLFFAGFVGILTECLPAGLLPDMARTLHTSVAATGQLVTLYAAATALGAIPLTRLTTNWPRKNVLQLALGIVLVTNALTAVSGSYALTLVIRFTAGLGTALVWPLLAGYAARLAPAGRQNRAIAIALAGTPVSLALGIPLGTYMAKFGGWQTAFWGSAALTGLVMLWVLATLPNLSGLPQDQRHRIRDVLVFPGVRTIMVVVAAYVVAHNILYTYITDFLAFAGMGGNAGWVLLAFGVTSVLSVLVVGQHIDHHLRKLVLASTVLFAVCVLVMAVFTGVPALIYVAAAAWGLAFGSSPSLFFAASIDAAKEAPDVAQSITVTVFSGSIAAGGLVGGLLIAGLGTASMTWAALILLVFAAVLVAGGRRHAFPSTD